MKKYCPSCGKQNPVSAKYCCHCGDGMSLTSKVKQKSPLSKATTLVGEEDGEEGRLDKTMLIFPFFRDVQIRLDRAPHRYR